MLNGSPLNSIPLGAGLRRRGAAPEYIVRGISYLWRLRLLVGGTDVSAQIAGGADGDREEGAAGLAGFAIHLATGPVVPTDWIGREVALDYLSTSAGVTVEDRRFTGRISSTSWDARRRVLTCECADQLQQRVEAMPVVEIDALTQGTWSADLFEPVEGRSRWDYAMERMESRTASLDCSPAGELRVTSWFATAPHFIFGPGTTLDESISLQLPELSRQTNKVEIEAEYRYTRRRQLNERFIWIGGGFCGWYFTETKELPTVEMVEEAVDSSGATLMSAAYDYLPPSHPDPCAMDIPWVNNFDNLLLGTSFTVARRWAQTVTERYAITMEVPTSITAAGEVVARTGNSFEIESATASAWESDPVDGGVSSYEDDRDEARRLEFLDALLAQARSSAVVAHRLTVVSWSVPTSMALGIDLRHTLELNDQGVRAVGKCCRVVDSFDQESGQAITTLSIAVMRGGGTTTDPLLPPAAIDEPQPDPSPVVVGLPTQLGGRSGVPPYDEELPGFSGNYSHSDIADPIMYPREFKIILAEIPAEQRDELVVPVTAIYNLAIPNDTLEF